MGPLHHIDLVVSSMERSLPFYRELLRPLGYVHEGPIRGERGEAVVYIGHGSHDASIGLREAQSPAHATPYDRYAVGVHHVAFRASARWLVDERAAWLRDQGVEIESGPADYDYIAGYYAVFFYDPDGIKLEIVHVPHDPDLAAAVRELGERVARLEGG
jgi:catechol 2,3-dioxygenase-like lactoylglutathione lyase family enzyme